MQRKRITITIKENALKKANLLVDGKKIRSRSQAIEFIISEYLPKKKIENALFLACGAKKDIEINGKPKFLKKIGEKTLLEQCLAQINGKTKSITVCINSWEKSFLKQGLKHQFESKINFELIPVNKESIFSLKKFIATKKPNSTFLYGYCDTLIELNFENMLEFHRKNNAIATLAVTTVSKPENFGVVKMNGSLITEFLEKPKKQAESHLVSTGFCLMEPEIINYSLKHFKSIENELFPFLAKQRKLAGFVFAGKYLNINTGKELKKARLQIQSWNQKQ